MANDYGQAKRKVTKSRDKKRKARGRKEAGRARGKEGHKRDLQIEAPGSPSEEAKIPKRDGDMKVKEKKVEIE